MANAEHLARLAERAIKKAAKAERGAAAIERASASKASNFLSGDEINSLLGETSSRSSLYPNARKVGGNAAFPGRQVSMLSPEEAFSHGRKILKQRGNKIAKSADLDEIYGSMGKSSNATESAIQERSEDFYYNKVKSPGAFVPPVSPEIPSFGNNRTPKMTDAEASAHVDKVKSDNIMTDWTQGVRNNMTNKANLVSANQAHSTATNVLNMADKKIINQGGAVEYGINSINEQRLRKLEAIGNEEGAKVVSKELGMDPSKITHQSVNKHFDDLVAIKKANGASISDHLMYHEVPKKAAGLGFAAWGVNAVFGNKGQQSNSQLYGQQ